MTERVQNLYQLARRARRTNDIRNAGRYYEEILLEDPNSWEAILYAAFYKIVDIKLTDLRMYALNMKNSIGLILSQIQNNVLEFSKLDKVLEEVTGCIDKFSKIIYSEAERYRVMQSNDDGNKTLERIGKEKEELIATCYEATEMMYLLGDYIIYYFGDDKYFCTAYAVPAWHCGIIRHVELIKKMDFKDEKEAAKQMILEYVEKIKKYDSSYQAPEIKISGCYIATSVYGSYDCPQVWTLRRFRDNTLEKRLFGKCFIKVYYAISPSLVEKFGKNYCFNNFWRYVLDVMVKKLNCQGVENTPYED